MRWPGEMGVRKLRSDEEMNNQDARPIRFGHRSGCVRSWRRRPPPLPGLAAALVLLLLPPHARAQEKLRVVTTLTTYAAIAKEVTGDLAEVEAIARGDEDPHFVTPRPSFAAMIRRADLFVASGLDLELWVPTLLDRAGNANVRENAPGYVAAHAGIELRDVPAVVTRAEGDVHIYGNPHIHTDPINAIIIARNIVAGLRRVDEENGATYEANAARFADRLLRRLFGDELVAMVGGDNLFELARTERLWSFLEQNRFRDRPLSEYLGGWIARGASFRNREMACYHKNWEYFSARFRVPCGMYVEPKVGIPPSPGHVRELVSWMRESEIPALFAANYFSRNQIEQVAERTGARAVIVPEHVDGAPGVDSYFALIDLWVTSLAAAYGDAGTGAN